jgi:hypothetical protein
MNLDKGEIMKFELWGKELETFQKWDKEHKKVCKLLNNPDFTPAIGGRLTFSFTPTGLGPAVSVECACGEKHNCTDYDSW